jgi:hypothetical protein
MDQTRQQARGRAVNEAYLASGAESRAAQDAYNQVGLSRYNMGGDAADRQNAMRGAQSQEAFALRNQPINEIMALMGGSQVTMPQFSAYQGQGVNAAPIGQYIGQNYQNQMAQTANTNSGIFGLGGAIAGALPWASMSDRRLKQDIVPIDGDLAGAPLYSFRYKAFPYNEHVGVMADEVRGIHPDAVIQIGDYDAVNYEMLKARHEGEIHHGIK